MIPVEQRAYDRLPGDCFPACIASILECPLDIIPKPGLHNQGTDGWADYKDILSEHFLKGFGLQVVGVVVGSSIWVPNGFAISNVILKSSDPTVSCVSNHAVVIYNGRILHDPNPVRNTYTIEKVHGYELLVPVGLGDFVVPGKPYPIVFTVKPGLRKVSSSGWFTERKISARYM